jgi:hypothetical protein
MEKIAALFFRRGRFILLSTLYLRAPTDSRAQEPYLLSLILRLGEKEESAALSQ